MQRSTVLPTWNCSCFANHLTSEHLQCMDQLTEPSHCSGIQIYLGKQIVLVATKIQAGIKFYFTIPFVSGTAMRKEGVFSMVRQRPGEVNEIWGKVV